MKRSKKTIGEFTVSTVTIGTFAECMVFDGAGNEIDALRVPSRNHSNVHKHMCALYRLGAVASYWAGSTGESVTRAKLRGDGRTI